MATLQDHRVAKQLRAHNRKLVEIVVRIRSRAEVYDVGVQLLDRSDGAASDGQNHPGAVDHVLVVAGHRFQELAVDFVAQNLVVLHHERDDLPDGSVGAQKSGVCFGVGLLHVAKNQRVDLHRRVFTDQRFFQKGLFDGDGFVLHDLVALHFALENASAIQQEMTVHEAIVCIGVDLLDEIAFSRD